MNLLSGPVGISLMVTLKRWNCWPEIDLKSSQ
jgi:hypothetical protein